MTVSGAVLAPSPVNVYVNLLATFAGAGRFRDGGAADRVRAEREGDQAVAAALARQGLLPWRDADLVVAVDLATEGALAGEARRELRPWRVFGGVARREAAEAAAELASFLAGQEPDDLARQDIVFLTLRRRGWEAVPVGGLAARHRAFTGALGPMLGYAARRTGDACVPLSYGVHHRLIGDGGTVDVHGHLTVLTEGDAGRAALNQLVEYLGKKWEVHEGDPRPAMSASRCASSAYQARTFSCDRRRLEAHWAAEYVRQVHVENHLHCRTALGPLRRHVGALRRAGVRPFLVTTVNLESIQPTQSVILRPIRCRPARLPRPVPSPVAPRVLACRLSWLPSPDGIGDQLRPVVLVRGWDGGDPARSWGRLRAAYDLNGLIEAARDAMAAGVGVEGHDARFERTLERAHERWLEEDEEPWDHKAWLASIKGGPSRQEEEAAAYATYAGDDGEDEDDDTGVAVVAGAGEDAAADTAAWLSRRGLRPWMLHLMAAAGVSRPLG